jgi:hypothetical protein
LYEKYHKYHIIQSLNIDFLIESTETKQLFDTLECYGFTLNYKDPTRKYGNCSSGIDYLVCNNQCSQYHASVFQSNISDHFHQILSIPKTSIGLCPAQTTGKTLKRIFSENTTLNFKSAFNFCNDNIGFYDYFLTLFNVYFPLKLYNVFSANKSNIANYFNPDLKNLSEVLKKLALLTQKQ